MLALLHEVVDERLPDAPRRPRCGAGWWVVAVVLIVGKSIDQFPLDAIDSMASNNVASIDPNIGAFDGSKSKSSSSSLPACTRHNSSARTGLAIAVPIDVQARQLLLHGLHAVAAHGGGAAGVDDGRVDGSIDVVTRDGARCGLDQLLGPPLLPPVRKAPVELGCGAWLDKERACVRRRAQGCPSPHTPITHQSHLCNTGGQVGAGLLAKCRGA